MPGGSVKRSLAMVWPFAIAKAFGLDTVPRIEFTGNLIKDMTGAFVDAAGGNLHLTAAATQAIDGVVPLPDVTEDIDRQPRTRSDIGADELAARSL